MTEERWNIVGEMIKETYEQIGFVVLDVEFSAPGIFKMQAIKDEVPRELIVTVLLNGNYINAIAKRE